MNLLLRQMYLMMERNRIYTMAAVILKEKNSLQTDYKEKSERKCGGDKSRYRENKISDGYGYKRSGKEKKLEEVTTEKLSQYDSIC